MRAIAKLIEKLQNKDYRDAFISSQININLPFQIRALREKREWTQGKLAKRARMLQPRISAMETPGKGNLKLETLQRIASAFDVGLIVRFIPFSEMVAWVEGFSPDSFKVPSFEEDRFEVKMKIPGVPFRGPGTYRFVVQLQDEGETEWKTVASVPLKIIMQKEIVLPEAREDASQQPPLAPLEEKIPSADSPSQSLKSTRYISLPKDNPKNKQE
jgi:transcriptional regulator with XRE-family HTH domain